MPLEEKMTKVFTFHTDFKQGQKGSSSPYPTQYWIKQSLDLKPHFLDRNSTDSCTGWLLGLFFFQSPTSKMKHFSGFVYEVIHTLCLINKKSLTNEIFNSGYTFCARNLKKIFYTIYFVVSWIFFLSPQSAKQKAIYDQPVLIEISCCYGHICLPINIES